VTLRRHVGRRLTDEQECFLYDGGGILSFVNLESTFGTMEAAREAWAIHGERLTAEYALRPWAWWQWSASESEKAQERAFQERRHTDQRGEPADPIAGLIPATRKQLFPQPNAPNGH
jgi:hypothetical protein